MPSINSIEINQFRGIKQLKVSDFSSINLIVGDNNSGKTTFLEAIQFTFANTQMGSVKNIIRQRTELKGKDNNFYVSFVKMFNKGKDAKTLGFDICAESNIGALKYEIRGSENIISVEDALKISKLSSRQKNLASYTPEAAKIFNGDIIYQNGSKTIENEIQLTSIDTVSVIPTIKKEVQYIPSFGHLKYDLLQNIIDNQEYKKLAVSILKQFDESIVDICYTRTDDGNYMETIVTEDGKNMPFSVYGDGIKKILFILNKLFGAPDSILLIDEIETGLHKKYYELLFPVVFELAKKLNIQLFIATHSIEAIDAILMYGKYENDEKIIDPIRVITLKKIDSEDGSRSNVVARNVFGKYVYDNRKAFEFEVRL